MKISTNISIDANLKKEAVSLFKDFGLDLSTAITLFLTQAVREQRIPFEITREIPNRKTLCAYNEVLEMEKNPDKYETFSNVETLMEDLNIK